MFSAGIFLCLLCLYAVPAHAAAFSVQLSAPKTLRAGESFSVSLTVSGTKIDSVQGMLYYDASLLRYTGSGDTPEQWLLTADGGNAGAVQLLAYDSGGGKPINGTKQLCMLRFQVKADVPDATQLSLTASDFCASDGDTDFYAAKSLCKLSIVPPLSAECKLESLRVQDVSLSPAFSPNTTRYSAQVPFSVKRLTIQAYAKDAKAKVTVQGQMLSVGDNTVKIVVRAENGAEKTYTLAVYRAPDPHAPSTSAATQSTVPSANETTRTHSGEADTSRAGTAASDTQNAGTQPSTPGAHTGAPYWLLVLVGIVCTAAGAAGCYFVMRRP